MGTDDAADAGRLVASLVALDPAVNGADNVQDALTAQGAASVFPVGPKNDGTNQHVINEGTTRLYGGNNWIGTDGDGRWVIDVTSKDIVQAWLSAVADAGPAAVVMAETTAAHAEAHLSTLGVKMVDAIDATLGFYGATPVAQAAAIPDPAGGATVDTQARAAIVAILDVLGAAGGGIGITA